MLSLVVHPRCETTLQTLNPQALATIIAHVGPGRIGNVVVPLLQDFEGVPLSLSREMKPAGVPSWETRLHSAGPLSRADRIACSGHFSIPPTLMHEGEKSSTDSSHRQYRTV